MSVSVLVVDDSSFFRKRLCEILNSMPGIKVLGTASNGRDAIELVKKLKPDVVTMDYEMPVMDGVTAVRHIMSECPTPILMFSSLSYEGARVTLDALEAGALDFLPKNFEDISSSSGKIQDVLKQRILNIAKKSSPEASKTPTEFSSAPHDVDASGNTSISNSIPTKKVLPTQETKSVERNHRSNLGTEKFSKQSDEQNNSSIVTSSSVTSGSVTPGSARTKPILHPVELLVIGASTGGPVALQKVLSRLPANFPLPILVIQHMPATFTPAFAERLNNLCKINVKHASDGDSLVKGAALIAPGAKQMILSGRSHKVSILEGDERLTYKPSVDLTFGSAAKAFPGRVLAVVLTGMGADGREGCRILKNSGSTIYTQNESTCVVYGMPMAVDKAGYSDGSFPIDKIAERIIGGIQ